jgi:hypothetical protein
MFPRLYRSDRESSVLTEHESTVVFNALRSAVDEVLTAQIEHMPSSYEHAIWRQTGDRGHFQVQRMMVLGSYTELLFAVFIQKLEATQWARDACWLLQIRGVKHLHSVNLLRPQPDIDTALSNIIDLEGSSKLWVDVGVVVRCEGAAVLPLYSSHSALLSGLLEGLTENDADDLATFHNPKYSCDYLGHLADIAGFRIASGSHPFSAALVAYCQAYGSSKILALHLSKGHRTKHMPPREAWDNPGKQLGSYTVNLANACTDAGTNTDISFRIEFRVPHDKAALVLERVLDFDFSEHLYIVERSVIW